MTDGEYVPPIFPDLKGCGASRPRPGDSKYGLICPCHKEPGHPGPHECVACKGQWPNETPTGERPHAHAP